jgi:anti-sigma regulatory factor (Ser/Thr protein kinase)
MSSPLPAAAPFRHEAYLYAGLDEFVDGMATFIRDGVTAGEPALVVLGARKLDLLREALGDDANAVLFADMANVGANPARIIPAWREFVADHAGRGRGVRGIGEPIYPERGPAELVECHRHEALLNVAFADTPGFRLVCPYDTDALGPAVIETARHTHPYVVAAGAPGASPLYEGLDAIAKPFGDPLPDPPPDADELEVRLDTLATVRRFVQRRAKEARLGAERTLDLLVAVNEVATNSVRHGGGRGSLLVWREDDALVCEVRDEGRIRQPLVGRERPARGQVGGRGVWLANQLCDLVQIRAFPGGGAARLHMRLG